MYDLIIIGSGASSLFLSANLKNKKVLVLEKMERVGKKILVTGGGMCNITNVDTMKTFLSHVSDRNQMNFIKPAIMNFSNLDVKQWFIDMGLPVIVRDDGKVFPKSLKAQSVIDTLYSLSRQNGAEFKLNEEVITIEKEHHFTVTSNKGTYQSTCVVLATGGMSYPQTGSTGDGYALAKALGHHIVPPTPALTSLNIDNYQMRELAGNAIRSCLIDFFHKGENKRYKEDLGDLLFTHTGVSGPVILNNSHSCLKGDTLLISLIATKNKEISKNELLSFIQNNPKKQVHKFLKEQGIITKLCDKLLDLGEIDKQLTCGNLSKDKRKKLVTMLLNFPLVVGSKKSFTTAMVTKGGLSLKDFNRKTLESQIVEGFYGTGEVLDIDGHTGGYNLTIAFSTAKLVCQSIQNKDE